MATQISVSLPASAPAPTIFSSARQSGNLLYLGAKLAAAGGTLAWMAGLDHGGIAACATVGAIGCAGLLALQRYSHPAPGRQQVFQATLHHAVYNDFFTMAGGLLGNLPCAALLQAGFSQLVAPLSGPAAFDGAFNPGLSASLNASISANLGYNFNDSVNGSVASGSGNADYAGAELSTAGFAGLVSAAALPLVLMSAFSLARARRQGHACPSPVDNAANAGALAHDSQAGNPGKHHETSSAQDAAKRGSLRHLHLSRRTMLRIAGMGLGGIALLAVPACVLRSSGANEQAVRLLIYSAGQCAGNTVRETLNQLTAAAWTAVRRDGEGASYGLAGVPTERRLLSAVAPTTTSALMFGATVALVHGMEIACGTAVVPQGAAILAMPASSFCARLALRATLVVPALELAEAVARCAGFGVYAAVAGTALEYRHRNGAGLFDVPVQFARHVRNGPCYERVAAFATARAVDGCLVNLLNQVADLTRGQGGYWNAARIAAILAQGGTLARTPLVAAWVLPRRPGRKASPAVGRRHAVATPRPLPTALGLELMRMASLPSEEEFESISLDSAESSREEESSGNWTMNGSGRTSDDSFSDWDSAESSDTYIGPGQSYL